MQKERIMSQMGATCKAKALEAAQEAIRRESLNDMRKLK